MQPTLMSDDPELLWFEHINSNTMLVESTHCSLRRGMILYPRSRWYQFWKPRKIDLTYEVPAFKYFRRDNKLFFHPLLRKEVENIRDSTN